MLDFVIQSNRVSISESVVMFLRRKSAKPVAVVEEQWLDDLPLQCRLVRSQRKSLAVHVSHDQIEVRAPVFVSEAEIKRFLDKHRRWVLRKVEEKQQRYSERLDLGDGGRILYKARDTRVVHQLASSPAVTVINETDGQTLRISGQGLEAGAPDSQAAAARILRHWLQSQAKAYLPQRTQALADYLGVGDKLKEVVFRKTRSKWGHCTSAGRIQYNWLIMLAPDGVIDYMISHEVCHLLHMNHSKAYWQAVSRVCPDYQRYVGWLKQHEHRLWF
ncbi:MAG: hypothetical protein CMQ46_10335 [Gammaproteobacteria bacterium]|nr:hypothetical protein [Gammaproteobacteria bacterium]MBJ55645.1 hypothetical protein [Gammaproteobacteria bacterium]HBN13564.1 hypothetical protein [Pseudohongiella sp.]|tara:strand:+ start:805 stop:1626 length:822 start_codon:yes stop_codon:yes gene_type:complete